MTQKEKYFDLSEDIDAFISGLHKKENTRYNITELFRQNFDRLTKLKRVCVHIGENGNEVIKQFLLDEGFIKSFDELPNHKIDNTLSKIKKERKEVVVEKVAPTISEKIVEAVQPKIEHPKEITPTNNHLVDGFVQAIPGAEWLKPNLEILNMKFEDKYFNWQDEYNKYTKFDKIEEFKNVWSDQEEVLYQYLNYYMFSKGIQDEPSKLETTLHNKSWTVLIMLERKRNKLGLPVYKK